MDGYNSMLVLMLCFQITWCSAFAAIILKLPLFKDIKSLEMKEVISVTWKMANERQSQLDIPTAAT